MQHNAFEILFLSNQQENNTFATWINLDFIRNEIISQWVKGCNLSLHSIYVIKKIFHDEIKNLFDN